MIKEYQSFVCYQAVNIVHYQAEAREKERLKEEARKMRRLEAGLRAAFKSVGVDSGSTWEDVRPRLQHLSSFTAITIEAERIRIFKVKLQSQ